FSPVCAVSCFVCSLHGALPIYLQMGGGKFRSGGQIDLAPDPGGTRVTWSSTIDLGPNPLMHYLGVMIRSGMGQAFDEGLTTLKRDRKSTRLNSSHQNISYAVFC